MRTTARRSPRCGGRRPRRSRHSSRAASRHGRRFPRVAKCANCGARVAKAARFCPQCGQRVDADDTRVLEVPPDETGPVPVSVSRAEARFYGVTPATAVLVLAGAVLTVAIVLFIGGHWPVGLILLGVTVLLVLVFLETARRKPTGAVSRSTAGALDAFRAQAGVAAESLATRGRTARQLLRSEEHTSELQS